MKDVFEKNYEISRFFFRNHVIVQLFLNRKQYLNNEKINDLNGIFKKGLLSNLIMFLIFIIINKTLN